MSEKLCFYLFLSVILGIVFSISFAVGTFHYKELELAKLGYCEIESPRGYTHWEKCNK